MEPVAIVAACRTPVGRAGGALAGVPATALGSLAVREAVARAGLEPAEVDEVILGNVLQAGLGLNPARKAQMEAGIPQERTSFTVNKACGSGLKAVALAAGSILLGENRVVAAGGMESMSQAPYLLTQARYGYRMGHGEVLDSMVLDGLTCPLEHVHMGVTAENIAAEFDVTREEQDAFAYESHRRAVAAQSEGLFDAEIVPVEVPQRKGPAVVVRHDEGPRPDTSLEALGRLRPAFKTDGTVTAGNASSINDGAAAVVVMAAGEAERRGLEPLALIRAHASAGVAPRIMGMGPVPAIRKALERAGLGLDDIDLFELNEAFAAQSLGVLKALGLGTERVNVQGGAVALGHPIGASGARILVTLLHAMARRQARRGVASLCIGGGQGIAMVVERP